LLQQLIPMSKAQLEKIFRRIKHVDTFISSSTKIGFKLEKQKIGINGKNKIKNHIFHKHNHE